MKKQLIFSLVMLFSLIFINSAFSQDQPKIAKDISVLEFNRLIVTKPGTILDVRTKGEVDKGVIKGAVNYDLFDDNFETNLDKIDKTKPVYVYCASGGRSSETMDILKNKGFSEVYNLSGGYSAWIKDQKK